MVQHLSARVFINKPKLEPYLQCSSSPNFCTSQPGLRGWGQNGGSLANFSFVHQRGVDTNYPAMSSQLRALPKPGRARVLLREDYGGERQARVSAWQGLSCWRPGRQGCWSPSAGATAVGVSAAHLPGLSSVLLWINCFWYLSLYVWCLLLVNRVRVFLPQIEGKNPTRTDMTAETLRSRRKAPQIHGGTKGKCVRPAWTELTCGQGQDLWVAKRIKR